MRRDPASLARKTFDVLVVGGGVYGLTIAYDAAQRGLSVALVERNDFGGGSSFNHLRTIHGGLRYLQSLDFGRARESILERRTIARIAPCAVDRLAFVLPLYPSLTKGPLAVGAGLALDRFIGRDRNDGVSPRLALPAGRIITRDEALERCPDLSTSGLTAAVVWYDYVATEADRLTLGWARAAERHQATLVNYVEATRVRVEAGRAVGVRASDRVAGRDLDIAARIVVNVTGASLERLIGSAGAASGLSLVKAMNLVTVRAAAPDAVGGRSAAGRHLFGVPWKGRMLFGTWESGRPSTDLRVTGSDVSTFMAELNDAFPRLSLTRDDVSLVHRGLVPAVAGPQGAATLASHEQVIDHAPDGVDGLFSVAGTKYTTARAVAERVTDRIFAKLRQKSVPCRTASTPLPGLDLDSAQAPANPHPELLERQSFAHLLAAYGSDAAGVLELATDRPDWLTPVAEGSPVVGAELVWAARHEMAITLSDAVIRRTPLGALGYPGDDAAARAADIVGSELGWADERKQQEITALRDFYRIDWDR